MKRMIAVLLTMVMCVALMTGCGGGSSSTDAGESGFNKITLTMAVNGTDTQIDTLVANQFKELVETATEGAVKVEVYPNDQLAGGNATKGIEMIADGSTDIAAYATSVLSVLDEKMSIGTVPWLFDSYEQARSVIDESGLAYYDQVLNQQGITVLGSFHNGFRQLSNSKHAVTAPEDLKGLKIRVPGSEVYMQFFSALGADPVAMNWGEVFTALQQGTIDGQENGLSITNTSGVLEVQDYVTVWNYTYENDLFLVNTALWDTLNEQTQQVIRESAVTACNWGRDQIEAEHDALIEQFRADGVQVDVLTEEQLAPFKEVVADLSQSFFDKYGDEACAAFGVK